MLGLVEASPRRGIRCLKYDFRPAVRLSLMVALALDPGAFRAFSTLRIHLETAFWDEAVVLLTDEDQAHLRELVAQAQTKLNHERIQIPYAEHRAFHLAIFSKLENPFVIGLLEAYWDAYEAVELNTYADYSYLQEVWSYHERIVEAIVAGDYASGKELLIAAHASDRQNGRRPRASHDQPPTRTTSRSSSMSIALQEAPSAAAERREVVNNFSLNIATINGSGSQTSNGVLLRTFFKMGIPVNGKNLFPSNIQGLPTWYIIRLSKDGYLARRDPYEVAVCMNGRTVAEDMAKVAEGGMVLYDDSLPIAARRSDVTYYPLPVSKLVKEANVPFELKDYIANMTYVGALVHLLGIDMAEIEAAVDWNFEGKRKPIELNMDMVRRAYDWARANLVKTDPYRVERMTGFNDDKILIDGNTAGALGSIWGGVSFVGWYPITPASSLADALHKYLPKLRTDPETGKATFAVIQAEDELAAIGMVIGAGWAGARAMTNTSGPGLDLMSEFAGLAYFAEVPAVIWDVQRIGPSTGLPTRTSQGDILAAYFLSHGDKRHPLLFPG